MRSAEDKLPKLNKKKSIHRQSNLNKSNLKLHDKISFYILHIQILAGPTVNLFVQEHYWTILRGKKKDLLKNVWKLSECGKKSSHINIFQL